MRFRKRINIAKGLGLNLSKSGASFSFGGKGASITIGKKGLYSNIGIPGTGLYSRQKIFGGQHRGSTAQYQISLLEVRFNINDNGRVIIKDKDGIEIIDESLLRKIKRTDQYKQAAQQLYERKYNQIEEETAKFINIYQFTPELKNIAFWTKELDQLKHEEFIEKEYKVEKPEISITKNELIEIAKEEIRSVLFWTNKEKRSKYIEDNFEDFFQTKVKEWENALARHKENEKNRKIEIEEFNKEIDKKREIISSYILKGNEDFINNAIHERVKDIELPVEFAIDYEYDPNGYLFIDLELPEIEDLPMTKAQILQSRKISIKKKTQKELRKDYATCVCGLAFYFAGEFFSISPKILDITVSGYTQRLFTKTGNIEDEYVYSVIFKRDIFEKMNIQKIDPIKALENFKAIINVTSTYELKTITPFDNNQE